MMTRDGQEQGLGRERTWPQPARGAEREQGQGQGRGRPPRPSSSFLFSFSSASCCYRAAVQVEARGGSVALRTEGLQLVCRVHG